MSLIVNSSPASSIAPIAEGTHLGVCCMLIDLGVQFNEAFKNSSRKVLIGWEIPDETIDLEDGTHNRTITKTYTASLNDKSNLRADLAAWRGRDFTPDELKQFDLHNIVGTSCLLNVIHKDGRDGKIYANIQSIMALPKGMARGKLSEPATVFDLDADPLDMIDRLPKWIGDRIKDSTTYQERAYQPPEVTEMPADDGDGELPF